jgi:hypothetical protein
MVVVLLDSVVILVVNSVIVCFRSVMGLAVVVGGLLVADIVMVLGICLVVVVSMGGVA